MEQQLLTLLKTISRDKDFSADTPLFSTGMLDSLSMLSFLNLVEETFNVTILDDSFDIANFDTVNMIENFLGKSPKNPESTG
ncbi:MAG: acyl carrier protein [Deltaproteobacteria bacterium]|nr:acyl carrier protein [Deltaproteobacteria bacterium]